MKAPMILATLVVGMVVGMTGAATSGSGDASAGGDIFAAGLGWGDTVLGERAGASNTTGNYNTFLGYEAGQGNTTGEMNAFCGYQAGYSNIAGKYNTFSGFMAGYTNKAGNNNTFLGAEAGNKNEAGSGNVFIGNRAGFYETGSSKLWIANDSNNCLIHGDFATGNIGIGTTDLWAGARLHVNGDVFIQGGKLTLADPQGVSLLQLGGGLDYAEGFDVTKTEKVGPGTVLVIDPANAGKLTVSTRAYDTKVAGIVAGAKSLGSGVRLGTGQFDQDVALAGRVYCNVDATETAVEPGDLLTTSATPGYAMKVTDHVRSQGAVLGKAMESLEQGKKGQILVLVALQ